MSHINHGDKNDHDEDIVRWTPALDEAIFQDLSPCLQLIAHLGQDQSLVLPPLLPTVVATAKTHLKCISGLLRITVLSDLQCGLCLLTLNLQLIAQLGDHCVFVATSSKVTCFQK